MYKFTLILKSEGDEFDTQTDSPTYMAQTTLLARVLVNSFTQEAVMESDLAKL